MFRLFSLDIFHAVAKLFLCAHVHEMEDVDHRVYHGESSMSTEVAKSSHVLPIVSSAHSKVSLILPYQENFTLQLWSHFSLNRIPMINHFGLSINLDNLYISRN